MAWWRRQAKHTAEQAAGHYRFASAVTEAATALHNAAEPGERVDTLGRVRLKPVGRAARAALQSNPADQLSDLYDPDTVTRQFYKPADEVMRYSYAPVKAGGDWLDPPAYHRLQLVEKQRQNGGWGYKLKEHHVHTAQALYDLSQTGEYQRSRFMESTGTWLGAKPEQRDYERYVCQFREAARAMYAQPAIAAPPETKLREASVDPFVYGEPGDGSGQGSNTAMANINQEFIPLMGGPAQSQLYLYAHWEQTAKAFYEKNHSELAKAAIGITTDFVLGRGISWKIGNLRVEQIWQEFWDRNKMENRIRVLCEDLSWQGELLVHKEERLKGYVTVRSIHPSTILEIMTEPSDPETVFYYHQSYPAPWQSAYTQFKDQHLNIALSRYVITQYPANEVYHVKLNVSASEKWGRSDYYAALGTLKRHRDWTNAATLKDMLQANLIWRIKVTGDDADVQAFINDPNNATLPSFGGTWIENTAISLEPMHEDVAGTAGRGQGSTGAFLTSLFATNMQMPVTYFNVTGTGPARATALVQGEPFSKRVASRQQVMRQLLDHLFEEAMIAAARAGRIPWQALRYDDADPQWSFPSSFEEDRGAKFRDLMAARKEGVISLRTEGVKMAQELGIEEYDFEAERAEIAQEPPPPMAPPFGGQPGQPGNPIADQHEKLAGADERGRFRAQQGEHPTAATQGKGGD